MRALYKAPDWTGFREIIIDNKLEKLQELVGGHIETVTMVETVTMTTDACVICNEEGLILGLDKNCNFMGMDFFGPILIVGTDGEEFTDCPVSVTMANGGIRG